MLIPTSTRATFLQESPAFRDRSLLDKKECGRLSPASRYQAGAVQTCFLCWFRPRATPRCTIPHQLHFCPQLLKPSKQPCGGSLANWTIWLKSSNHLNATRRPTTVDAMLKNCGPLSAELSARVLFPSVLLRQTNDLLPNRGLARSPAERADRGRRTGNDSPNCAAEPGAGAKPG